MWRWGMAVFGRRQGGGGLASLHACANWPQMSSGADLVPARVTPGLKSVSGLARLSKSPDRKTMTNPVHNAVGLREIRGAAAIGIIVVAAVFATPAASQGIDANAVRLLKASTDFVAKQQRFSVETRNSLEVVLKSGQKIEFNHSARMSVQRPDRLRAERTGDLVDQTFVYDGRTLTMYNPSAKAFAQVAAPNTLEAMLDLARNKLDIVAPAGDLVYQDAYAILMDGVTEGFVVGKAVIEGVRCDHLAFRAPHVDWQIWIQEGAQPLPRRMLITTRDLPNAPQFGITMTRWNLKPQFAAGTFEFTPPAGANKVDFLPR
jgi:hypothetical protein